jgi:hypothetical protein
MRTVQELLAAGADITKASRSTRLTALHEAARFGHDGIVQLLLDNGADAKAAIVSGHTAFHLAAYCGHARVVTLLLAAGADVHQGVPGNNTTALHMAAAGGHMEVAGLLLSAGANVAARDLAAGFTPLHAAAVYGHAAVVAKLIVAGADVHAVTYDGGHTPIMLAAEQGHLEVVELLVALRAGTEQALVDVARGAAGRGHMAIWACIARKMQGVYPHALGQCVAGVDAVAVTRALITGWEGEVDRHVQIMEAAKWVKAEGEAAKQQAQQLIIQTALMQKQLERSLSERGNGQLLELEHSRPDRGVGSWWSWRGLCLASLGACVAGSTYIWWNSSRYTLQLQLKVNGSKGS